MDGMRTEVAVDALIGPQQQPRSLDQVLAELAERQHGVIARKQLLRIGFTPKAITVRLRTGRLHPIHRGVYAVGHKRISLDGRRMAAVLACGDGAAMSHRDGAATHGMRQCNRRVFEVTVPRKQRARPGIQLHCALLPADEVTTVRGIPVTTVPRTLLDLAAVCPRREVEKAMKEAEVARLWDRLSLPRLTARYPHHRGAATIRAILESLAAGDEITKEEIVSLFLRLIDGANIPRPALNQWVGKHECDCVWPRQRVMVELDGYAVHGTRSNFETDRERDRFLHARGWLVIRVTWRQLRDDPEGVVRDLRAVLANCGKARPTGAAPAR
jgi:very-short-patch-repair endonuclease/predicted transcriptional regulator of viral defense system